MNPLAMISVAVLVSRAVVHSSAQENNMFDNAVACDVQEIAGDELREAFDSKSFCEAKIVSANDDISTAAANGIVPFQTNELVCYGLCGPCGCDECGICNRELLAGGPYDWVPFNSQEEAEDTTNLVVAYDEDCGDVPDKVREVADVIGSSQCLETMNNGDGFLAHYSDMCQKICNCPDLAPEPLPCVCLPCTQRYPFADKTALKAAVNAWINDQTQAESVYGDINCWDTSEITSMSSLFYIKSTFNGDISCWDTSRVTKMQSMFNYAQIFDQDISGWDVSRVTSMFAMFSFAGKFDQDLSGWDVSKVTSMYEMFNQATAFKQQLCWDVRGKNTFQMFKDTPNGGCIIKSSACCPDPCTPSSGTVDYC